MRNKYKKEEILELYINQDKTVTEIAKIYNTHTGNISRVIKKFNFQKKYIPFSKNIEFLKIIKNGKTTTVTWKCKCGTIRTTSYSYIKKKKSCGCKQNISIEKIKTELKSLSIKEVAKKYNYTYYGLLNKINKNQINHRKNYTLKHDFFKTQSHAMYYILGFIAADGCVHPTRPYTTIELNRKDISILSFIKEQINPKQKLLFYIRKNKKTQKIIKSVKLCFYSNEIKSDLNRLGIIPNKTKFGLNIDIKSIPDLFLYDFIRGFFDGDGCVSYKKTKQKVYLVTKFTCSDLSFLLKIKDRINLQSSIQKEKKHYNLILNHKSSVLLYQKMYENDNLSYSLQRKKEKYINDYSKCIHSL